MADLTARPYLRYVNGSGKNVTLYGSTHTTSLYSVVKAIKDKAEAGDEAALADYPAQSPILVGCPSCKVGITRSLMAMHERRPVLHTVEWLATLLFRERWGEKWIRVFRRQIAPSADAQGVRIVELDG